MTRGPVLRPIALMAGIIVLGGIVLGLLGWAAMGVLPESDAEDPDTVVDLGDPALSAVEVAEDRIATPDDAVVDVDTCEVVDGVVQVAGRLQNTSGAAQAFVVHVGVVFDGQLFDGLTADIGVPTTEDGDEADWAAPAGSVDLEDEAQQDPECEVDRVGLGVELGS
jgi:hypothetical protein